MPESLQFDNGFQLTLLALILKDENVVVKLKHLEGLSNVFEDDLSKACVDIALNFYKEYANLPTQEQLLFELEKRGHVQVQKAIQAALNVTVKNPLWYAEQVYTFIYHQNLKNNLIKAASALESGDLEKAKSIVHASSKLTQIDSNLGINLFDSIEDPYTEDIRKVSTSIEPLDVALNGGLGIGELGLIMAPPGVGKSMMLCYLGKQAILHNYRVAHLTFELSGERTRMRYEAGLTGIPTNELRIRFDEKCRLLREVNKDGKFNDSLYIIEYPTKACSISKIQTHLDTLADRGFIPDLIIVDYLDIIAWDRGMDKRDGLGANTEGLRMIAGERKIPVWSATQTNREAVNKIVYGMENVAECFEKVMIADIIVTICQTEDEYKNDLWRLFMAKNRGNRKGQEIEVEYNFDILNLNVRSELLNT